MRCGAEITACMGFSLARDIVNDRRPVRELCGRCVERPDIVDFLASIMEAQQEPVTSPSLS
jgi:hypothetical protein